MKVHYTLKGILNNPRLCVLEVFSRSKLTLNSRQAFTLDRLSQARLRPESLAIIPQI